MTLRVLNIIATGGNGWIYNNIIDRWYEGCIENSNSQLFHHP